MTTEITRIKCPQGQPVGVEVQRMKSGFSARAFGENQFHGKSRKKQAIKAALLAYCRRNCEGECQRQVRVRELGESIEFLDLSSLPDKPSR